MTIEPKPAERYHVRHAAAEVLDALSRAAATMAVVLLGLLGAVWLIAASDDGTADIDLGWVYAGLALAAGALSLSISADRVRSGTRG